mgnify:CR=1 FL=1
MPLRKTVPGTAVTGNTATNKPDIAGLVAKAKEGKASQEDLEIMGQAEKDNPGILAENGAGKITIQAAEDAINGKEVPPAEKDTKDVNPKNSIGSASSGIDDTKSKIADLQSKIAPNNHDYESPDVFNPKTKTSSGYRSIVSDVLDVIRADKDVKTAKNSDEVRSGAKAIS